MGALQYTTVDRVLAKFHRDLRGTDINESDAIEWIGEALGFLRVPQIQEQALAFLEVKNYQVELPKHFQAVLQVARKTKWSKEIDSKECITPQRVIEQIKPDESKSCEVGVGCNCGELVLTDCDGNIMCDYDIAYYRPYFDLKWEYSQWRDSPLYRRDFVPVRLSNNTFFGSLVCEEKDYQSIYKHWEDEYTIVGTTEKYLRFSFKEGLVALSYLRNVIDTETGYPLVPDDESYLAAITYYMKWKIAERMQWNGREGANALAQDNERKWLKYARQAKSRAKMPKTLDDYQNLLEQTHSLPNLHRYYNFFGNRGHLHNTYYNRRWQI